MEETCVSNVNEYKPKRRWGSSVSIVTRLWTRRPDFKTRQGNREFFSPPRQDRFWDLLSPQSNGYWG